MKRRRRGKEKQWKAEGGKRDGEQEEKEKGEGRERG